MNYKPELEDFDIKYNFLLPLPVLVQALIMALLAGRLLGGLTGYFVFRPLVLAILFFFLLETIISSFLHQSLELPDYLLPAEWGVYWVLLYLIFPHYRDPSLWISWIIGMMARHFLYRITARLSVMAAESRKFYKDDTWKQEWNIEDFKYLKYPEAWKGIAHSQALMDLLLIGYWVVAGLGPGDSQLITETFIVLGLQFGLVSWIYYEKKALDWYLQGISTPLPLAVYWKKTLVWVLMLVLVISFVLPAGYSPLTFREVASWLNSRFSGQQRLPDFKERGDQPSRKPLQSGQFEEQEPAPPWVRLMARVVLYSLGILLAGLIIGFILHYVINDLKKTPGLIGFFIKFYLAVKKITREIMSKTGQQLKQGWQHLRPKSGLSPHRSARKRQKQQVKQLKRIHLPRGILQLVRLVYGTLLKLFALRGQGRSPGQTPYEYSRQITDDFPDLADKFNKLTEIYVELIYSPHQPESRLAERIRNLWSDLRKRF